MDELASFPVNERQCKAARALLSWTQAQLAERANVGLSTVISFEAGSPTVTPEKAQDIRLALETNGVMFLDGDGVTLRRHRKE